MNASGPPTPDTALRPLLWLVAAGVFMQMLDSTIVNTALPAMARDLAQSPLRMQAVVVARYPEVGEALAWLAQRADARMTGSGGCVFAAFASREAAQAALQGLPGSMRGFVARGLEHHPLREVSGST
jgi:4-diphosphocytidyl-2C-methyl-D-erythritol kinase